MSKFDFTINDPSSDRLRILTYDAGGCHPAGRNELLMWDHIKVLEEKNAELRRALDAKERKE